MPYTKRSAHYGSPKQLIEYILDEKNIGEKVAVASSLNCNVDTALYEMLDVQKKYEMQGNRVAYHIIQSFALTDKITPEQANEIARKLCKELYPDFQCVIATHCDSKDVRHLAEKTYDLLKIIGEIVHRAAARIDPSAGGVIAGAGVSVVAPPAGISGIAAAVAAGCRPWNVGIHSADDIAAVSEQIKDLLHQRTGFGL